MGYLSRNDLEKIATRIFNDYKHLPRLAGQHVDHVDPVILACGLFGLHIEQDIPAKGIQTVLRYGQVPWRFKTGYGNQTEKTWPAKKRILAKPLCAGRYRKGG